MKEIEIEKGLEKGKGKEDNLIQEDQKKEEKVCLFLNNNYFLTLELIIDHNYKEFMKFPDVLYDGTLPNYKVLSENLAQKEKKKQQKSGIFGIGS